MLDKQSIKLENLIYFGISLIVLNKIDLNMRAGLVVKNLFFSKIQGIILAHCNSNTQKKIY